MPFGKARPDEHHLGAGVFLLGVTGGIDHGAARLRDEGLQHGGMLVHPAGVCRAAGGGHEGLPFLHFLLQFLGFVGSGDFCAQGYFHHVVEADLLDGCQHLPRRGVELPVDGGGGDGDDLFLRVAEALVYVDDFRTLHDGAVGACLHALPAVDALAFVDVLHAFGVLADGFDRADVLAGHGREDNGMVGAHLLAQPAAHAVHAADARLAPDEGDGVLGAVHDAGASLAAPAKVGHGILRLDAGAACLVYDGKDVLLHVFVRHRHAGEVGQMNQVDFFVGDFKPKDRNNFVFQDVAVFVDAASYRPFVARSHFHGDVLYLRDEFVFF